MAIRMGVWVGNERERMREQVEWSGKVGRERREERKKEEKRNKKNKKINN